MRLAASQIDAAAFARFGFVIDSAARAAELVNDGTTRRHSDLVSLDLRGECDPVLGIYVAQARVLPMRVARLERHRRAAQVFVPLGGQRFIVVVAPGEAVPEWPHLSAFVTRPGQGVVLKRGCWHHGLVALNDGDRFAVIEGGDYRRDTEEVDAPGVIELVS